jgi:hypothetical protein
MLILTFFEVPGAQKASDECAPAAVEVEEAARRVVGTGTAIESVQSIADVCPTAQLALKRQKADLLGSVELAQLGRKFEAVNDLGVSGQKDVLRAQVTVRVADATFGDTACEQREISRHKSQLRIGDGPHTGML